MGSQSREPGSSLQATASPCPITGLLPAPPVIGGLPQLPGGGGKKKNPVSFDDLPITSKHQQETNTRK